MYVCGTMDCVVDMFLGGRDSRLGGKRVSSLYSINGKLIMNDTLVATHYGDHVVLHPIGFIPGSSVFIIYDTIIKRVIGRTALVHMEPYSCVPRVRIYAGVKRIVDLSMTCPIFVYLSERSFDGLELCPEMLEINHFALAWAMGLLKASDVAKRMPGVVLMRASLDGGAILKRLNVDGRPFASFYMCDPDGDFWVGVASMSVRYGATRLTSGCVEAVRPFDDVQVQDDVKELIMKIRSDPYAVQLVEELSR